MIDALTALRLQVEWGADDAIGETPVDRFAPAPAASTPARPVAMAPAFAARSAPALPMAETIDALQAEIEAFTACPLKATATHTVRPDGAADARLLVVGDAPGSDDDRSGRAFSGPTGEIVDRVFASIGLDRQSMLLTNLVPWRPPGNRPLTPAEIDICLPFVHRLIGIVRPRWIILLGAAPIRALAGETATIRRLRGSWLEIRNPGENSSISALPLPPVNQWLRDAASKQQLWSDLLLLYRTVTTV